jgi:hypothetical protein
MIPCHCFLATLLQPTWASLDASKKGKKTENVSFARITWIASHNMILRWVIWGKCSTETVSEDVLYCLIREKKTLNFWKFGSNVALISKLMYCSRNSLYAMGRSQLFNILIPHWVPKCSQQLCESCLWSHRRASNRSIPSHSCDLINGFSDGAIEGLVDQRGGPLFLEAS